MARRVIWLNNTICRDLANDGGSFYASSFRFIFQKHNKRKINREKFNIGESIDILVQIWKSKKESFFCGQKQPRVECHRHSRKKKVVWPPAKAVKNLFAWSSHRPTLHLHVFPVITALDGRPTMERVLENSHESPTCRHRLTFSFFMFDRVHRHKKWLTQDGYLGIGIRFSKGASNLDFEAFLGSACSTNTQYPKHSHLPQFLCQKDCVFCNLLSSKVDLVQKQVDIQCSFVSDSAGNDTESLISSTKPKGDEETSCLTCDWFAGNKQPEDIVVSSTVGHQDLGTSCGEITRTVGWLTWISGAVVRKRKWRATS